MGLYPKHWKLFRVTFWVESKAIVFVDCTQNIQKCLESNFLESKAIALVDCTQDIQKCLEPTFEHKVRL